MPRFVPAQGGSARSQQNRREHAKSWGAGPRSGTSRARRRGGDGPKAVRRVRLAMELPQPGVPMENSPPRFCMLSGDSRMTRRNVSAEDRALGMDRPITRRDVLHGAGLLAAAGALGGTAAAAEEGYPPLRQGLRGSQPGSFEAAHALRDGAVPPPRRGGRGGALRAGGGRGRDQRPRCRALLPRGPTRRSVLILDNHDDFGGHARRNEFRGDGGRLMLMNGGTMSIDSPRPYGAAADGLLRALGVRPEELEARCSDRGFYARSGLWTRRLPRPRDLRRRPPGHRGRASAPGAKRCGTRRSPTACATTLSACTRRRSTICRA